MEKKAHLLLKLIVCVSELAATPTTKNTKKTVRNVKVMGSGQRESVDNERFIKGNMNHASETL
jgi:hypothetical protein